MRYICIVILTSKLTLSGQPIPRAQLAGEDHALQLLDE